MSKRAPQPTRRPLLLLSLSTAAASLAAVGAGGPLGGSSVAAREAPALAELRARHPGALATPEHPASPAFRQGSLFVAAASGARGSLARSAETRVDAASVEVLDAASGARLIARHASGPREAAEVDGAFALYPAEAAGGPALLRRFEAEGVEELLVFEEAPARREARWELALGGGAAGLRLVGRVLEVLDEGGAPRLRMPAPWIEDARGTRHAVDVDVEGCFVDTSPAAPWGRRVRPPGAETCELVLRWSDLPYPAVLDPAWTTTGSMTEARLGHSAIRLDSGNVLIVGGAGAALSAELYNPPTGTFAATGSLDQARDTSVVAKTGFGDVLVLGGDTPEGELYDASLGTWIPTGAQVSARSGGFSLTSLENGDVLVAGGNLAADGAATDLAEIYDASTNTFAATGSLAATRQRHAGARLPSGEVMIFAGEHSDEVNDWAVATEIFDPISETWSSGPPTNRGWEQFGHATLTDGRIVLWGDCYCSGTIPLDVYEPGIDAWVDGPVPPNDEIQRPAIADLEDGRALLTGGYAFGTLADVLVLGASSSQLMTGASMTTGRSSHTATRLSSGEVLVAGGQSGSVATASAELYAPAEQGEPCDVPGDCASGVCAGGVCCDVPCDGACVSCLAGEKSSGPDGECGPRPSGLECGEGSCGGSLLVGPSTCDGAGSCVGGDTEVCTPYLCVAGACATSCVTPADCDGGYACEGGACVEGQGAACTTDFDCPAGYGCDDVDGVCRANEGTICALPEDCLEGACVGGVCCADARCVQAETCTEDSECSSGKACRFGECVVPPPAADDDAEPFDLEGDGGCGCALPGGSPGGLGGGALAAAALASALLRRRSRRPR